jgi:hypothetical protein
MTSATSASGGLKKITLNFDAIKLCLNPTAKGAFLTRQLFVWTISPVPENFVTLWW